VNNQDCDGNTVLMSATSHNKLPVVKYLIAHGADVNAKWSKTKCCDMGGTTALMLARSTSCASLLIDAGANVNASDESGSTALMHASEIGNRTLVKLLISKSAIVNVKNKDGETPVTLSRDHPDIIAILKAAGATE